MNEQWTKRVRVKICGITHLSDAHDAVLAGADAIGLVFVKSSKRFVSVEQAKALCAIIPPYVSIVGLFANQSALEIESIVKALPLDQLQFHGNESPHFCADLSERLGKRWYKAVPMNDLSTPHALQTYLQHFHQSSAFLLDAFGQQQQGGSGKTFTWQALPQSALARPLIIAGGLTAENVGEAIRHFRPFAVDVSSGVETAPAKKSFAKMKTFIDAVVHAYDAS